MSNFYSRNNALIFLSGTLALASVACSSVNFAKFSSEPVKPISASPVTSVAVKPQTPAASPPTSTPAITNPYERALDVAESAASISQSAQSSEDWNLVVSQWQYALALLKAVPGSSPNYALAKNKITQYQGYLKTAQKQSIRPTRRSQPPTGVAIAPTTVLKPISSAPPAGKQVATPLNSNSQVFSVPIKRRVGRTPVIDVTFNGIHTFEMIVDTGASTTVITPAMVDKIGVVALSEVMADTASAKQVKFRVGKVESIAVDGAIARNVPVAIASSVLDIGLLGQDFFGNYDIAIKSNVVEFSVR